MFAIVLVRWFVALDFKDLVRFDHVRLMKILRHMWLTQIVRFVTIRFSVWVLESWLICLSTNFEKEIPYMLKFHFELANRWTITKILPQNWACRKATQSYKGFFRSPRTDEIKFNFTDKHIDVHTNLLCSTKQIISVIPSQILHQIRWSSLLLPLLESSPVRRPSPPLPSPERASRASLPPPRPSTWNTRLPSSVEVLREPVLLRSLLKRRELTLFWSSESLTTPSPVVVLFLSAWLANSTCLNRLSTAR